MRHSVGVVKTVTSIEAVERLSYLREGVVEYHEKDGEDEKLPDERFFISEYHSWIVPAWDAE
jgi:hypothetical protein